MSTCAPELEIWRIVIACPVPTPAPYCVGGSFLVCVMPGVTFAVKLVEPALTPTPAR